MMRIECSLVRLAAVGLVAAVAAACDGVPIPPVPDTGVSCTSPNYIWNEATNPRGPNLCSNDCECDGARTCVGGRCEGTSRPPDAGSGVDVIAVDLPVVADIGRVDGPQCGTPEYVWNEATNPRGPNLCNNGCECDGARTCVGGRCEGTARPTDAGSGVDVITDTGMVDGPRCGTPEYVWNEATNPRGPNLCNNGCECDGARTCVGGRCEGTARPTDAGVTACGAGENVCPSWATPSAGRCQRDCTAFCARFVGCPGFDRPLCMAGCQSPSGYSVACLNCIVAQPDRCELSACDALCGAPNDGGVDLTSPQCGTPAYVWNEATNPRGPNLCNNCCECDGARRCVGGRCEGTARPTDAGVMTCGAGTTLCAGACVATATSVTHCGACGNVCPTPANGTAVCAAGVCGVTCQPGFGNCDGNAANGCETNLNADRSRCGTCTTACAAGATCTMGACACPLGLTMCGGACVNLTSSTANCGACGNACTGGNVCRSGVCGTTCASGSTRCGTDCVTLGDDPANCGSCGRACASTESCQSGVCVSPSMSDPVGCADGTREAFADRTRFPNIAACAGAWALPGIFPAIPASTASNCATLGNSSTTAPADGAGCASSNLCARGWHICNGGEITERTTATGSPSGCGATTDYPPSSFFAAAVSGTGCFTCALRSFRRTGAMCGPNTCQADCQESGDLNNDFFGCGSIGRDVTASCDGLNRTGGNNCGDLSGTTWNCGGATMESRTVSKSGSANGGVLCCR